MPTKLEARVAQHDREIAAIRKLLLQGSRILVRIEAAQKRADKRRGGNGRGKTDIR